MLESTTEGDGICTTAVDVELLMLGACVEVVDWTATAGGELEWMLVDGAVSSGDWKSRELVVEMAEDLLLLDKTINGDKELGTTGTLLLDRAEFVTTWLELFDVATGDTAWGVLDVVLLFRAVDVGATLDDDFAELLLMILLVVAGAIAIVCVVKAYVTGTPVVVVKYTATS